MIRPTFLVNPRRDQVVTAKVWASTLFGGGLGLVAGTIAAGAGTAALSARGITVRLDAEDYALVIIGGCYGGGSVRSDRSRRGCGRL